MKKIVYAPIYKTFVIDLCGTGGNIATDVTIMSEANQLVFLNLWNACRLQIDVIGYLVYDKSSDTLNIDPLDISIGSVLLDESQRSKLDAVLVICENLIS
jgi:hypothetical protein